MVQEMVDLGFNQIELSHGVRITLVPGILRAVEEGLVTISSTHNFCPLPMGITQAAPNLFQPSSGGLREHELWLRHTRRSIDFAVSVNATVLVCHFGSVGFFWMNPADRLAAYSKRHPKYVPNHPRYKAALARARDRLQKRVEPFWERTKDTVSELFDYAKERGVRFGVENREKLDELPLDEDLVGYFNSLPADVSAGYWHDTGHAQIKQSMGLIDHRTQLSQLAPRTIGFHLHDVNAAGQDHQPIGSGQVDFNMIREFLRPEHVVVLELSPRTPVEGVIASRDRLNALLG